MSARAGVVALLVTGLVTLGLAAPPAHGQPAAPAATPAAAAPAAPTPTATPAPTAAAPTPAAAAAPAPTPTGPPIRVYTKPIKPFSFQEDGANKGFSLDLWERVAREANVPYEIHWVKTVGDLITALRSGQADVAIAAISITSEREALVDFSTPYYESGLGILVNAQGQSATGVIFDSLTSAPFLKICGLLAVVLLVFAHGIWVFERRRNPDQFPVSYGRGIWESSWWAISTILSGGCDNKGPVAFGGRIIGALWMLICIFAITYFTASITTIMTVNQLTSDINGASDLVGQKVATAKGTTAEKYLTEHKAKVVSFASIDEAFDALDRNDVKAVVYDEPILLYHLKTGGLPDQKVVGHLFERQNYGIGLPENSPYRKAINGALLKLREQGVLDELHSKWFGDQD
jgi:ABC-type amino acid transport substrate-binding protein